MLADIGRRHLAQLGRLGRVSMKCTYGLIERLAVDVDLLLPDLERLAGKPDHPLDEVAIGLSGYLNTRTSRRLIVPIGSSVRSSRVSVGPKTNLFTSR